MKQILKVCLIIVFTGALVPGLAWARGAPGHGGALVAGHAGGWGGHSAGGYHGGGWRSHPVHGGWRVRPSIGIGFGYGSGFYGGYPWGPWGPWGPYGGFYGYPPTVITVPTEPPVYIQQPRPAPLRYQPGYWYYCTNPPGYYPTIRQCITRWRPVEPRPSIPR